MARSVCRAFPIRGISQARETTVRRLLPSRRRTYSCPPSKPLHEGAHHPQADLDIRYVSTGHKVATVTICNPAKANVLTSGLVHHLISQLRELQNDSHLRAVVITGASRPSYKRPAFVGGADISEMAQLNTPEKAESFIFDLHTAFKLIRELPVPTIARVHGVALGAGLELMCACDLRIATLDSTFGMPEVKLGIPSVIEAALLPSLIGMGRTRRMLYLGEEFNASDMERWGLIEKLVETEDQLDDTLEQWLEIICSNGPKAMRIQKRLMQAWEKSSVDQGILLGVEAFAEAYEDGGHEPKDLMGKLFRKRDVPCET